MGTGAQHATLQRKIAFAVECHKHYAKNTPDAKARLVMLLLVEQNDEWAVNRRYFSLESMLLLKSPAPSDVPMLEATA